MSEQRSEDAAHVPVLAEEVVEWLALKPNGIYVDGTYGRGGHSALILEHLSAQGRLLAFDRDPAAARAAGERFGNEGRFEFVRASFSQLGVELNERGLAGSIDGLLLDVGVSSPQLDDPERGFSFMHDGPLDMRMDPESGASVAEWINGARENEIADVIYQYGEERFSRRIARAIVERRKSVKFTTTADLAAVIARAMPRRESRIHPATRSFQALRIFINRELEELRAVLGASLEVLAPGGRLLVISFHSLEDRIVKRFMRDEARSESPRLNIAARLIRSQPEEARRNPRARSARLRVAERTA
ncbi:MAG: 16S rRNA (cytosine(1402)-N(4))-methyltransferase RsmH [Gammaproteobacteria bacterium]